MRRNKLMYGIGLIFDPQTASGIREVWRRLASQGFATPLVRSGCLPHVSLLLSETLYVDQLAGEVKELVRSHPALEIRFSTVGISYDPEILLFYGITPTEMLMQLHAKVERIYQQFSSAISARYQSGVWVPHCTLAGRVEPARLQEAIAAAATPPLPFVATQVQLAIVQFDQLNVEVLKVLPLNG